MVAEVDAWRWRELLKEEMMVQMSKLQAIERQRIHFQGSDTFSSLHCTL